MPRATPSSVGRNSLFGLVASFSCRARRGVRCRGDEQADGDLAMHVDGVRRGVRGSDADDVRHGRRRAIERRRMRGPRPLDLRPVLPGRRRLHPDFRGDALPRVRLRMSNGDDQQGRGGAIPGGVRVGDAHEESLFLPDHGRWAMHREPMRLVSDGLRLGPTRLSRRWRVRKWPGGGPRLPNVVTRFACSE